MRGVLGAVELPFQPSNMLVAGCVVSCNFSFSLLDVGDEPQGDLLE